MSWLSVQLHRLADARAATAGLMGLALITSLLFAGAPRVIDAQSDQALHSTVLAATADTRNISVLQTGRISVGAPDSLSIVSSAGDQFDQRFPASVTALVTARYLTVDTARFRPLSIEGRTVRMRYLQGASDRIDVTSGRLPTGLTAEMAVDPNSTPTGYTAFNRALPPPTSLTTFEVALSVASAHDLGVGVGDTIELRTDETDKTAGWSVAVVAIKVVGIYEVTDGSADFWFADTSLERPQIRSLSSLNQIDDITALIAPDAYTGLYVATQESGLPFNYTWRYAVDPARMRTQTMGPLMTDLRRLDSVFLASGSGSGNSWLAKVGQMGPPSLQTGLLHLVGAYASGWRSVSEVLSIAEVGGAAMALLALSLLCLVAGRRRAGSLSAWQNRGASRSHVLGAALVEVLVELALPVAAGLALAVVLVPNRAVAPSIAAAGLVLAFSAALLIANTMGQGTDAASNRGAGIGGRGLASLTRGAGPRRLMLEGAVVAVAAVGAYVLRQRGVAAAGSDSVLASPDPFIAAVPALIGAAAALAVARLLPIPLEMMARVAERGRGFVTLLALRRATRRTNDRLLLTTLLTMAAVWSFAAVSLAYLGRASDVAGWQTVGADYRISLRDGAIPPNLGLEKVPGVQAAATAAVLGGHLPESNALVSVMALDLANYRDVVAGGPPDGAIPNSMIEAELPQPAASGSPAPATGGSSTSARAPVAAVVSAKLAATAHIAVGDLFDVVANGARPTFKVAAIRDTFPTLPAGSAWIVVGRSNIARASGAAILPTEAFVRGAAGSVAALTDLLKARLPGQAVLTTRQVAVTNLQQSPEYVAVMFGLLAASLIAALYGALAIFAALMLAGAEQSRESAHLRILGLSRIGNLGLSAMEHGPASVLVILAGIALGSGLFLFLQSSLGLGQLVGGDIDVGLPIEAAQVLAIFIATGVIVAIAVATETIAESIIKPTAALRRGMD